jgi:hypothetical protein
MTRRRGLLVGLGALLAAPAIIRTPGLLMPTSRWGLDPMWLALVENPDGFYLAPDETRIITQHCQIVKVRHSEMVLHKLRPIAEAHVSREWDKFAFWRTA